MNIDVGSTLLGNFNYPTAIRFGNGRIEELPDALDERFIERCAPPDI